MLVAALVASCTSAANPRITERNAELICPQNQAKVCPGAPGTASRIKKDEGTCYCASPETFGD